MSPAPSPTFPAGPVLAPTNIGGRRVMHQVKRGMILWGESPAPTGSEQAKRRPWVVVSSDQIHQHLPIVQVAPCTSQGEGGFPDHRITLQSGTHFQRFQCKDVLDPRQTVLTEQVRVFAHEIFMPHPTHATQSVQVAGMVNVMGIGAIEAGLAFVFDMP